MAHAPVKTHRFTLRYTNANGLPATMRDATLVSHTGNTVVFRKGHNDFLLATPGDILSIRLLTWDNVKKEEGTRKVTLEGLKQHLATLKDQPL